MNNILEIAVFSAEGALIADRFGADRIELCSSYADGGITPSYGVLKQVRKDCSIPVYVMIRPRGGDFTYSSGELASMKEDIRICRDLGYDGLVFGCLDERSEVDLRAMETLLKECGKTPVTFHRAFDRINDQSGAMNTLISLNVERILTSGGKKDALSGAERIRELHESSKGRIIIMPGAGITAGNIALVKEKTGCTEFHSSAKAAGKEQSALNFGSDVLPDPAIIAQLKAGTR